MAAEPNRATEILTGQPSLRSGFASMARPSPRAFVLSPAFAGGMRARFLLNPRAAFPLARQFHAAGLPLAETFAFMSGLYFRGKIGYARHFARAPSLIRVITANAGLWPPDRLVRPDDVSAFARTEIEAGDREFFEPLQRDLIALSEQLGHHGSVVLLGSIATPKYREVLTATFGERALFPADFVGRGDMSRGALLLRAVRENRELPYAPLLKTALTGRRASRAAHTP
jgi:hypothetical protein